MKQAACPQPGETEQPAQVDKSLWFVSRTLEAEGILGMIEKACFGSSSKAPWGYLVSEEHTARSQRGWALCSLTAEKWERCWYGQETEDELPFLQTSPASILCCPVAGHDVYFV